MPITIVVPERDGGSTADIAAAVQTCEAAAALVGPYADQIEAIAAMLLGGRLDFSLPANSPLLGVI
jgi:hypothetical protein